MQLVVITPEHDVPGEALLGQRMLEDGLFRLHIRKPSYSATQYRDYINRIPEPLRMRLVIHGHFALCGEMGLGGIHLSSFVRAGFEGFWNEFSSVSTSYHAWEEFAAPGPDYDYAFISPVFNSISKPGYGAGIAPGGASAARQAVGRQGRRCPGIYGLGGVRPDNIGILHRHGFDGAAMLGAIWEAEYPFAAFTDAMDAIIDLEDY